MIDAKPARVSSGVAGLDDVLDGGLTRDRLYLLEGTPGAGKTTMALQFLLDGAAAGDKGLYITLSETIEELRASAATHGWSLDGFEITEIVPEDGLDPMQDQSILHASELELGETIGRLMQVVERIAPQRVVFDSLSEFRLLAQSPLRYRRQVLALKQFFARQRATVLLLDDRSVDPGDLQLHSIAHGVIRLEQTAQEYGTERRRLRVLKMRGTKFQGGYHDFNLETGGLRVFPRLVASNHHAAFGERLLTTGSEDLDRLMGGGLVPGTNLLLAGPSGVGKTTTAAFCMAAVAKAGLNGAYYVFDEGLPTLLARSASIGIPLQHLIDRGMASVTQIDPAILSPGEFSAMVRTAVARGCRFVVIDSLNAYLQSMPGQQFLLLHMHELLTFLNQQGVVTLLIVGQHGVMGEGRSDIELSYLSDCMLLFRYFEASGEVRTALSMVKSRSRAHERTIHEFRLSSHGISLGAPLAEMEGVLSGLPRYQGSTPLLGTPPPAER